MAELKQLARQIFHETLAAIDIPAAMRRKLWRDGTVLHCGDELVMELSGYSRVCVIAIGKAAHALAEGLTPMVAGFCDGAGMRFGGIVTAPTPPDAAIDGLKYFAGGHPIPNEASLQAGRAILEELRSCDERTLVFFLLSGGGSAPASDVDATTVFPSCDVTQNGTNDASDVQKMLGEVLGRNSPVDDLNNDGKLDAVDIELTINAAQGKVCWAR